MQSEFYRQYMRSEKWTQKKQERLEIDHHQCCMCGRDRNQCKALQVHHIHYKTLGAENPYSDLVTVCGSCHKKIHNYYQRIRQAQEVRA